MTAGVELQNSVARSQLSASFRLAAEMVSYFGQSSNSSSDFKRHGTVRSSESGCGWASVEGLTTSSCAVV
jgi:hypothetical protein